MMKIETVIQKSDNVVLGTSDKFPFALAGYNVEGDVMFIRGFFCKDAAEAAFENAKLGW